MLGFSFKDCALTENELQPYPSALTAGTFRSGKQTDVDVSAGSSKDSRSVLGRRASKGSNMIRSHPHSGCIDEKPIFCSLTLPDPQTQALSRHTLLRPSAVSLVLSLSLPVSPFLAFSYFLL